VLLQQHGASQRACLLLPLLPLLQVHCQLRRNVVKETTMR
jgi:hypothetical protein